MTHGEGFAHQLLHCVRVHCVAVGMATKLTDITSLVCVCMFASLITKLETKGVKKTPLFEELTHKTKLMYN